METYLSCHDIDLMLLSVEKRLRDEAPQITSAASNDNDRHFGR
jgi:hypothetical protein